MRGGPTARLATWFWEEILERDDNPWTASGFPRYLSEAKRALKTLSLEEGLLKQTLLEMKRSGFGVQSILLPTLWQHHKNGPCWYDWMKHVSETPPPVYEAHAFRAWCKRWGHEDWLDE